MFVRRIIALALTLTLIGAAVVPRVDAQTYGLPAAGATLIRYKFVAGRHTAYRVALDVAPSAVKGSPTGVSRVLAALTAGVAISGTSTLDQQVLSVDPSGVATVQLHLMPFILSVALSNYTTPLSRTIPGITQTIEMGPQGVVQSDLSANRLGIPLTAPVVLPAKPVVAGTHWTSAISATLPQVGVVNTASSPAISLTIDNVFSGTEQAYGESAAVITSTAPAAFKGSTKQGPRTFTVSATGTLTARTVIGLTSGQMLTNALHEDLRLTELQTILGVHSRTFTQHLQVDLRETKQ